MFAVNIFSFSSSLFGQLSPLLLPQPQIGLKEASTMKTPNELGARVDLPNDTVSIFMRIFFSPTLLTIKLIQQFAVNNRQ